MSSLFPNEYILQSLEQEHQNLFLDDSSQSYLGIDISRSLPSISPPLSPPPTNLALEMSLLSRPCHQHQRRPPSFSDLPNQRTSLCCSDSGIFPVAQLSASVGVCGGCRLNSSSTSTLSSSNTLHCSKLTDLLMAGAGTSAAARRIISDNLSLPNLEFRSGEVPVIVKSSGYTVDNCGMSNASSWALPGSTGARNGHSVPSLRDMLEAYRRSTLPSQLQPVVTPTSPTTTSASSKTALFGAGSGAGGNDAPPITNSAPPSDNDDDSSSIPNFTSGAEEEKGLRFFEGEGVSVGESVGFDFHREGCDRNVFIFHLSSHWDEADLVRAFERFGQVVSVKIMRRADGAPKGYGFVCFEDPKSAEMAVACMNGLSVGGKQLRVSLKKTPEQVIESQLRRLDLSVKDGEPVTLFVFHLPSEWKNDDLFDTFAPCGRILSARVSYKKSGISCGYGFVTCADLPTAKRAIVELNGKCVGSKRLKIQLKTPTSKPGGKQSPAHHEIPDLSLTAMKNHGSDSASNYRRQGGRSSNAGYAESHPPEQQSSDNHAEPNNQDPSTVFVFHVPNHWRDGDLARYFSLAGPIVSASIQMHNKNCSKGYGFVTFETPEIARAAVEQFHRAVVDGGKCLKVSMKGNRQLTCTATREVSDEGGNNRFNDARTQKAAAAAAVNVAQLLSSGSDITRGAPLSSQQQSPSSASPPALISNLWNEEKDENGYYSLGDSLLSWFNSRVAMEEVIDGEFDVKAPFPPVIFDNNPLRKLDVVFSSAPKLFTESRNPSSSAIIGNREKDRTF